MINTITRAGTEIEVLTETYEERIYDPSKRRNLYRRAEFKGLSSTEVPWQTTIAGALNYGKES